MSSYRFKLCNNIKYEKIRLYCVLIGLEEKGATRFYCFNTTRLVTNGQEKPKATPSFE